MYIIIVFSEVVQNEPNNRPIVFSNRLRNLNRNRIVNNHNRNTNNRNRIININRENLLIAEREEFECNICYDINTRYYNIPCLNIDHIVCENCSKNRLFNLNKCPWCNVHVTIVNFV